MPNLKQPSDELEDLHAKSKRQIFDKLINVGEAVVRSDAGKFEASRLELRQTILGFMQLADLMGRKRMLLEGKATKALRGDDQADVEVRRQGYEIQRRRQIGIVVVRADGVKVNLGPGGPVFTELIADLLARTPELAQDADEVARLYQNTHAFAAVGAPDVQMAERVQKEMARMAQAGTAEPDAVEVLQNITDWTKGYAGTVYRTNMTTAYAAGRWKKASDPDIAQIGPAFRYDAVGDSDTRENHSAADGLIAGINDNIWNRMSPPLGYNCRCTIVLVDRFDLEAIGAIKPNGGVARQEPAGFSKAGPDSNRFGNGRPDRRIYGF